jgi:queuine/archaeosine tRNA-ribosyltransferase
VTSFKIIENGDYDIILLEEVKDCENKEQLRARERHYIESLDCVNKTIPGRTNKEYYQLNKDFINNKKKAKYEENKNKINAKIICPCCNTEVLKRVFKRHEKTIKHVNNLENSGENKKEFETMIN